MRTPSEIVASLGYELLQSEPLVGGVSAKSQKLSVQSNTGSHETWVLREASSGVDDISPGMQAHILEILASQGLPVPHPIVADEEYLVTSFIEGSSEPPRALTPTLMELANALHQIHQTRIAKSLREWIPELSQKILGVSSPVVGDERLSETLLREVAEQYSYVPGSHANELCHGDFWPGNVLWANERIVGIIDWEDCCLGNRLYDVANARLEILWKWGQRAMEQFTDLYADLAPFHKDELGFWDLLAAGRPVGKLHTWGLPPKQEQQMVELHQWFVQQALS